MNLVVRVIISVFVISLLLFSCLDDDGTANQYSITLEVEELPDLGSDFIYEGWFIVNDTPVSIGQFPATAEPIVVSTTDIETLLAATGFEVTIEPAGSNDGVQSNTKIMAGNFNGSNTTRIRSRNAIVNFAGSSGTIRMRTNTDGPGSGNNRAGFYFMSRSGGVNSPSLELPTLPEGWKYEGWITLDGVLLSTGKFTAFDQADENAALNLYGDDVAPPFEFPGEEFFQNAPEGLTFPAEMRGQSFMITVEPSPDNSPDPFPLIPLAHMLADDAGAGTNHNMNDPLDIQDRNIDGRVTR